MPKAWAVAQDMNLVLFRQHEVVSFFALFWADVVANHDGAVTRTLLVEDVPADFQRPRTIGRPLCCDGAT